MSEATPTWLPRYKSHKVVAAIKIKQITIDELGVGVIVPEEEGLGSIRVTEAYLARHDPKVGGYFVIYGDGYQSWSPAEAFEAGYTRIDDVMEAKIAALDRRRDRIDGTSDDRVVNNVMRHEYRVLGEEEKVLMGRIKDMGLDFFECIDAEASKGINGMIDPRCGALAKTKIEEAVMWAIKGLTGP